MRKSVFPVQGALSAIFSGAFAYVALCQSETASSLAHTATKGQMQALSYGSGFLAGVFLIVTLLCFFVSEKK